MEKLSLKNLEFDKILEIVGFFASSIPGREKVVSLHPLAECKEIDQALSELDETLRFFNSSGKLHIEGIRDIRGILSPGGATEGSDSDEDAESSEGSWVLAESDFLDVKADILVSQSLKKQFEGDERDRFSTVSAASFPNLSKIVCALPDLDKLSARIDETISPRGELRDDASPELARILREQCKTREDIEKRLTALVNSDSTIFQDSFFTIRNDRYVVPVIASSQSLVQGILHDQSASGQTVFIEPLAFLESNNRLVKLKVALRNEIIRILRQLSALVYNHREELLQMIDLLAHIDLLCAKARFAMKYRCERPTMTDEWKLSLKGARHPLIFPDCVPISLEMDSTRTCIVITGPNGGGKTVALKTLGVCALLAQSGCFPPLEANSVIPVFRDILADIGEAQSIEQSLSTFTAKLQRMKGILDSCGPKVLVLMDEIGAGTDPAEGAALAHGVLKEIRRLGAFSAVTSHYEALKRIAFATPGFVNAGMEFDYKAFRPTFRLVMGIPGKSNALAMARRFGLPEAALSELTATAGVEKDCEKELLEAVERERSRAEALRRSWVDKCRTLDERQAQIDQTMEKLEEFRKTKRDSLVEAFSVKLKEQRRSLEKIIHDLKEKVASMPSSAQHNFEEDLATARDALSQVGSSLKGLDETPGELETSNGKPRARFGDAVLKEGAKVVWVGTKIIAVLKKVDRSRNQALIEHDGVSVTVSLDRLAPASQNKPSKAASTSSGTVGASSNYIRPEVDLRGMRVEEAIEKVRDFLSIAAHSGHDKVFIIHGKGTGALQKAVHEYLKTSSWRKQFRLGRYGEGDHGVTVVSLTGLPD